MIGGRKKFPPFNREGRKKFYPVLRGAGAKSFGPAIFPFCSPPPLPVINDQSLTIHSLFCHLLPYCDNNTDFTFIVYYFCYKASQFGQFDFAKAEIKMNESWAHILEIYHIDNKKTEYLSTLAVLCFMYLQLNSEKRTFQIIP